MKIFPASLLALVFLSSPVGPLAAGETGVTDDKTPTKPAVGYSGEQTADPPAASAAKGTDWFSEAKFGMFIHWGLYAVTEGEWRGKKVPYIGEWIMHEEKIPIADYLERKVKPQLREILTNYGPIGMIWFDTPTKSLSREQAKEIKTLVKELQPDCLVSARIGHGLGDFDGLGDNEMPDKVHTRQAEACITLNDTWGYKAHDQNWKSADAVRKMRAEANAKNTNVLLNIGPQPDGRFPAPAIAVLENLAATREIESGKAKETESPR
jgi:alpha-L-fucosidase